MYLRLKRKKGLPGFQAAKLAHKILLINFRHHFQETNRQNPPKTLATANDTRLQFELILHKTIVFAPGCDESRVRALLGHSATGEYNNVVGIAHCAEPMCHHYHGTPPKEVAEISIYGSFVVSIERIGRLIKKNVTRIFRERFITFYSMRRASAALPCRLKLDITEVK